MKMKVSYEDILHDPDVDEERWLEENLHFSIVY